MSVTSAVKIADYILKNPTLKKIAVPLSKTFVNYSGYRQLGLRFEDLIAEETPIMQKAISRLSAEESYARNYRMITAHQLSLSQEVLPESLALKEEEDKSYIIPLILELEAEAAEKDALDNAVPSK